MTMSANWTKQLIDGLKPPNKREGKMHRRSIIFTPFALLLTANSAFAVKFKAEIVIDNIQANVIFLRHALAPGFGDPNNFKIGDCSTQRNLDEKGQTQARELGEFFVNAGIKFDNIYSSEWCRCWQTAELLGLGEVTKFSGLNSFFQDHAPRESTLKALECKLDQLPNDRLTLMVTHQVVIKAITGASVGSGEAVAFNAAKGRSRAIVFG